MKAIIMKSKQPHTARTERQYTAYKYILDWKEIHSSAL